MSQPRYFILPPHARWVNRLNPNLLPGIKSTTRFSTNAHGIRGDEFAADQMYRILAMGSSATECRYLDDADTWSHLLQVELSARARRKVWVGNVGRSARDVRHNLIQVQRALPQYPRIDAVILMLGAMELNRFSFERLLPSPTPNEVCQAAFSQIVSEHTPRLARLDNRILPVRVARNIKDALRRQWLAWTKGIPTNVGGVYAKLRRARQSAETMIDSIPDWEPGLSEFARHVNTFLDFAQAQPLRVILMTHPMLWRDDLPPRERTLLWMGGVPTRREPSVFQDPPRAYYTIRVMAEGMRAYNARLMQICATRGIECVDLAVRVPKDVEHFYDDGHFNENGARYVARVLADYLMTRPPLVGEQ